MTVKQIILQYIKFRLANGNKYIRNSDMIKASEFGFSRYGKMHNIGTYERKFRALRNDQKMLDDAGIVEFRDVSHKFNSAEKTLLVVTQHDLFTAE